MADDEKDRDDEFERFENLTRELLKVPKSELDKKRGLSPPASPEGLAER
jgi:hypothetical protein